jgi:hypothetical protein
MAFAGRLRVTNRRARVAVGLILGGLFFVLCTRTEATRRLDLVTAFDGQSLGRNAPEVLAKVRHLAETDHIALLEYCLAGYGERYRNYTCGFVKQERIDGRLGEAQQIRVKFMESPYSVAMRWEANPPIADRILYVEGKYDNRMLARPANALLRSLVGSSVLRRPDGPEARQSTLRPVNVFGFKRSLESLLGVYRQAEAAGDLETSCGGRASVAGREAIVLVRHLPARSDYPARETRVYIDTEYLLPFCVESYDWDGRLSSRYVYRDVKFNVALTADDFLPKANGLTPPR